MTSQREPDPPASQPIEPGLPVPEPALPPQEADGPLTGPGEAELLDSALADQAGADQVVRSVDADQARDAKNLGRNSLLMASGTLVSRILGMVNATLQVWVLGGIAAANAGDAFASANTLPNMIYVLLGTGVLNAVLLPQITKAMKRADGGTDFINRLLTSAFALVIGVAAVCTLAAPILMRLTTRLQGPALQLAVAFGYLCLPQIAFYGIFAILGNVLNARGSFGAFGWAPVANNVVAIAGQIVFLMMWGGQPDPALWSSSMVLLLAGSATLGIVVQCLVLWPALRRTGFAWRPVWGLRGHGFGAIGRFSAWTFAALCIAQLGGLVVMSVATGLDGGHPPAPGQPFVAGYNAYQKALVLFQVVPSLIAVSILTALFPQLARAWQSHRLRETRTIVRRGLILPALGIIPASVLLIALAQPIVSTVYFSLDVAETDSAALILAVMAASTLSYAIAGWQQQYCFASEQGKANLVMQVVLTLTQVAFAVIAMLVPPQFGIVTIAIGMVVGNTVLAVVFLLFVQDQLGGLGLRQVLGLYGRTAAAAAVGGLGAWLMARLIGMLTGAWIGQPVACVLGALVFAALFLVTARLLRITEFFDLIAPLLRRFKRVTAR